MKKLLFLLLALALCLALCACDSNTGGVTDPGTQPAQSQSPADQPSEGQPSGSQETGYTADDVPDYAFDRWYDSDKVFFGDAVPLLELDRDYTCTIDGIDCTWRVEYADFECAFLSVSGDGIGDLRISMGVNKEMGCINVYDAATDQAIHSGVLWTEFCDGTVLAGDWSRAPGETVTINPDGTITKDGNTWSVRYESSPWDISEDGSWFWAGAACNLFHAELDDGMGTSFFIDMEDGSFGWDGRYYKGRTWTVVELTPANFEQYYEFREKTEVFQEEGVGFAFLYHHHMYVLKEEYRSMLDPDRENSVALRISYTNDRHQVILDLEKGTYSVGEIMEDAYYYHYRHQGQTVSGNYNGAEVTLYTICVYRESSFVDQYYDLAIEAVSGTLHLIND